MTQDDGYSLRLKESHHGYQVVWVSTEESLEFEEGLMVGQKEAQLTDLDPPAERVERAAQAWLSANQDHFVYSDGYALIPSKRKAQEFLKVCKHAHSGQEPEWAIQARKAGWTPPPNWTP